MVQSQECKCLTVADHNPIENLWQALKIAHQQSPCNDFFFLVVIQQNVEKFKGVNTYACHLVKVNLEPQWDSESAQLSV